MLYMVSPWRSSHPNKPEPYRRRNGEKNGHDDFVVGEGAGPVQIVQVENELHSFQDGAGADHRDSYPRSIFFDVTKF